VCCRFRATGRASIQEHLEQRVTAVEPVPRADIAIHSAGRPNRDFVLRRILVTADLVAILAALVLTAELFAVGSALAQVFWGLVSLPVFVLLFKVYGLYDRDAKRVSHSTVDDLPWIFHALLVGTIGLWLLFRYSSAPSLNVTEALAFFGIALGGVFVARAAARALSRFVIPAERVLFVGGGPVARVLARKLRLHPEYELEPIGYVDTHESAQETSLSSLDYLGTTSEIDAVCRRAGVERVLILSPEVSQDELADLIRRLRSLDVRIGILPHIVDVLGPSVEVDDVEGITVLGMTSPKLTRSSRALKRGMDVLISFGLLVLFAPVMLFIAIALKLGGGPVFFVQERIGREGRRFRMLKFRTMVPDADKRGKELWDQSAHPVWLLLEHDPRITRFGRFLRHTSLDELPQLWNVLRGDMSLVGPRPMPPDVDEHISGWGRRRLDLTPGITGLWQVLGRTNIPFEEMVKLDYLYVTNWSLWQDVRLLVHTLPAVFRRRGVN
jgi:exopolysaccharide biosynthesis polyprenyl glycosylphosphotransferase